jgi:putative membrane protein
MTVADLPALNASLNALSALLLAGGYVFIRKRQIARHRFCMLSAFAVSTAFLASYVVYHSQHGSTAFPGHGWIRPAYFVLLLSHVLLAVAVVPLASLTLYRARQSDFARHRRLARLTLPIWMYVSVTGVLVYWILYHLYGAALS